MSKDEEIDALKALVFELGEAAAGIIEQELKSNYLDDLGHQLRMNTAFIALGKALQAAVNHAETNP